jgi:hypothetical protein
MKNIDPKDEWKNDGIASLHVKNMLSLVSVNEYDMDMENPITC